MLLAYFTLEIQRLMLTSDSEYVSGAAQYLQNELHPVKYHCKQPEQRDVKVERCSLERRRFLASALQ